MDELRARRRAYWQRRRRREGIQAERDLAELKAAIREEIEAMKEEHCDTNDALGCVVMALGFLLFMAGMKLIALIPDPPLAP
jgi:hypothetical protein